MNISDLVFSQKFETHPIDSAHGDIIIAAYPTDSIRFAIYQPGFARQKDGFTDGVNAYTLLTMTRTWIVKHDIRTRPDLDVEEAAMLIITTGEELTNTSATVYRMLLALPPVSDSETEAVA